MPAPDELQAFPVLYASEVQTTARFYERLGFARQFEFPPEDPSYVGLVRGRDRLGVVSRDWPLREYGVAPGTAPTGEMFVYVDDVDAMVDALLAAGHPLLKAAGDMPWGERVGFVADPDGRPVAIAAASPSRG